MAETGLTPGIVVLQGMYITSAFQKRCFPKEALALVKADGSPDDTYNISSS